MNKLSKGTLLLAIGVFALGAVAGAGGTYLAVGDKDKNTDTAMQKDAVQVSTNPELLEQAKPDTSVPAGTLSPTTVVNSTKDYLGKEITLHGMLVKLTDNSYLLSGKETESSKSIVIVFENKDLKVDELVSTFADADPQRPKGTFAPVNAKGKLSEKDGKPTFTATELSK